MKKIIIAILSTMLMTQSIVPVIAEGTLITEFSEEQVIHETNESSEEQTITSFEELEAVESTDANVIEKNEDENNIEEIQEITKDSNIEIVSSNQFLSGVLFTNPYFNAEYGISEPISPGDLGPIIEVGDFTMLQYHLQTPYPARIKLTRRISFPSYEGSAVINIPSGARKELDMNYQTLDAGLYGQIQVNSDYFYLKNGLITGGYSKNTIPSTKQAGGFIYAPRGNWDASLIIENVRHDNPGVPKKGTGGFIVAYGSNIFFKGNNTLNNSNFNVVGGAVTFLDGNFNGQVNRMNGNAGLDNNGDGTINIAFARGKDNERRSADQYKGDRRIYVKSQADVTLTNPDNEGSPTNTNAISNFSVITVDGSLRINSKMTAIQTVASKYRTGGGYSSSDAQTHNGHANIYINEGATFVVNATPTKMSHGNIYSHYTTLNVYKPALFDLRYDYYVHQNFFHVNDPSDMNLYEMDIEVWNIKDKNNNSTPNKTWKDVNTLEVKGFEWVFSRQGKVTAKPNIDGIGNFKILDYSRIRSEGEFPIVIPDSKYNRNDGNYHYGNGDGTENGPKTVDPEGRFFGISHYRNFSPVVNGKVVLQSDTSMTNLMTTTNSKGEWEFDKRELPRKVGWYSLYVIDGEGRTSRKEKVYVTDTIAPKGETKLVKIEEGDKTKLLDASLSIDQDYTYDETSPKDKLRYEYLGLSESERLRIISTVGMHNLTVGIYDEANNELRKNAPVLVYKKGTDPDKLGYIEGHDFEIDKHVFENADLKEKRKLVLEYGDAKAYEYTSQGYNNVTDDLNKFKIDYGTVSSDGKRIPITLSLIINGQVEVVEVINAILVDDSIIIRIHQVEEFYDKNKGNYSDAKIAPKIMDSLVNKTELSMTTIYYPKPKTNASNIIVDDLLENLENQNRIQLERTGYTQVKHKYNDGDLNYSYVAYTKFQFGTFPSLLQYINYNSDPFQQAQEADIYIEYKTQNQFLSVPNLEYGDIDITSKKEETHPLRTQTNGSGPTVGTNQATVINTQKKETWSINLALKDNKIINLDANGSDEIFLGGLIYFRNGQEFDITADAVTLESYKAPNKNDIDLIKNIDFYSQNSNEGIRLKQRIGNTVGNYSGDLIWTLTDSPIP